MKRSRIGNSGLVVNGKLTYFKTRGANFRWLLQRKGQAYFDRTRFISVLDTFDQPILFLRPRRFGKSLTVDMLEHFHGLQFKDEHGSLYQGLDVQRDISKGKATPGKYFILKLDFSRVSRSGQPETDFQALNDFLNLSIEKFYKTYAKYLGDFTDLKREIHNDPNISLGRCVLLVQETLSEAWKRGNSDLTDVQGIYLLVDEYDCFSSDYLEPFRTGIPLDIRFKSFFSAVKSMLMLPGGIQKVFMTGISPLSLTHVGSGFNVAVNLSFTKRVAALCGLTGNDIEMALKEVCGENSEIYQKHLSIMTKSFNGFYFCRQLGAETVYNSETCLDYLQRLLDGDIPEAKEPPNSEVSIQFLNKFSTSGGAINDLEEALKCDERGNFKPFKYGELKQDFMVEDLNRVAEKSQPAWRSLMISFGGLTFCPEDPANYLRIPNSVAARRIAEVVLEKYGLRFSLNATLDTLVSKGHIQPVLSAYRDLMVHRDVGYSDYNKSEETHRDSFYFALRPQVEFPLTLPSSGKSGRVDLILPLRRHLVVTEWKVIRIDYLDIKVPSRKAKARHGRDLSRQAKASILNTYMCDDVLGLKFSKIDTTGRGGKTIRQWIENDVSPKLRDYITSAEVRRKLKEGLLLRAHLVVIVGSRHILMWDVDDDGELTNEPYLVHEEFR
ncbi:putative AAA-ATPase domain containing protein [Elaphomyces granulatus]